MRRRKNVFDATLQLLEFAEAGRLRTPDDARAEAFAPATVMVASSVGLALGAAVTVLAAVKTEALVALMGIGVIAAALTVLIPALNGLRAQRHLAAAVRIERADYRPIDLLQRGNWINHAGTWVRIDQAGTSNAGSRSALLSSGEIINLREPVLVATGRFEPDFLEHVAP